MRTLELNCLKEKEKRRTSVLCKKNDCIEAIYEKLRIGVTSNPAERVAGTFTSPKIGPCTCSLGIARVRHPGFQ
jgi:hypothetical protein